MEKRIQSIDARLKESIRHKNRASLDMEKQTRAYNEVVKKNEYLNNESNHLMKLVNSLQANIVQVCNVVGHLAAAENHPLERVEALPLYDSKGNVLTSSSLQIYFDKVVHKLKKGTEVLRNRLDQGDMYRDDNHKLNHKVEELESICNTRLNEAGLSSHGDLLVHLSTSKGEIQALKTEVSKKNQELDSAHSSAQDACNQRDNLQKQLAMLQGRLAKANDEINRLASSDLGQALHKAESERDTLLEYITNDMKKSSTLLTRVSELEAEYNELSHSHSILQQNYSRTEELYHQTEAALSKEVTRRGEMQNEINQFQQRVDEQHKNTVILSQERSSITSILERKQAEYDELARMQMALLSQSKLKDDKILLLETDIKHLTEKVGSSVNVTRENEELHRRLAAVEKENLSLQAHIGTNLTPKLNQLEPEVISLRSERLELQKDINKLQNDLSSLRPLKQSLDDLNDDLTSTSITDIDSSVPLSGNELLRSQLHATWTNLPTIRHLSASLANKIRVLLNDLYKREIAMRDYDANLLVLQGKYDSNHNYFNEEMTKLQTINTSNERKILELKEKLLSSDEELMRIRGSRTTMDQIRLVLLSYPGGIQTLLGNIKEFLKSTSITTSANLDCSQYNNVTLETLANGSITGTPSPGVSFRQQSPGTSSMEEDIRNIPEHYLPDIVGRALLHNSNSVIQLQETTYQLRKLTEEADLLKGELIATKKENESLRFSVNDLQRFLTNSKSKSDEVEDILRTELDGATSLVEKQNALTITLEAKIESLNREKQLKSAQLVSLQQREENIRFRLHSLLHEHGRRASIERQLLPPEGTKLNELIQWVNDLFIKIFYIKSERVGGSLNHHIIQNTSINTTNYKDIMTTDQLEPSIVGGDWANTSFDTATDSINHAGGVHSPSHIPTLSHSASANISRIKSRSNHSGRSNTAASTGKLGSSRKPASPMMSPSSKIKSHLKEAKLSLSSMRE